MNNQTTARSLVDCNQTEKKKQKKGKSKYFTNCTHITTITMTEFGNTTYQRFFNSLHCSSPSLLLSFFIASTELLEGFLLSRKKKFHRDSNGRSFPQKNKYPREGTIAKRRGSVETHMLYPNLCM